MMLAAAFSNSAEQSLPLQRLQIFMSLEALVARRLVGRVRSASVPVSDRVLTRNVQCPGFQGHVREQLGISASLRVWVS